MLRRSEIEQGRGIPLSLAALPTLSCYNEEGSKAPLQPLQLPNSVLEASSLILHIVGGRGRERGALFPFIGSSTKWSEEIHRGPVSLLSVGLLTAGQQPLPHTYTVQDQSEI